MRPRTPNHPAKHHRRFHSDELAAQRSGLREDYRVYNESQCAKVDAVKGDTAKFFSEICHLKPFTYQLELAELYKKNQFLAVRWPRQTGKSTSIGGLLLQDAYENPDLNIGFIGPSWRQTKKNLGRVAGFCRNLPQGSCHIQKTRISFKNGSIIEAFPNNPDTIRGNTFHRLWWDETNFTAGDEDLYDAILFTLTTTNGKLKALLKTAELTLKHSIQKKTIRVRFFGGLDLAQTRDFCVFSIMESLNDRLYLRFLKIFHQPTTYAHVLGFIKQIQDRFGGFDKIRVDYTLEGPSIITDMVNSGINNAEGVTFSVPRKSEMASLLKQRMSNNRFFYPLLNWEKPYRGDICTELNVERYDLRKDGTIGYSHPNGTHDDVFWSIALGVFATVEQSPEQFVTVIPR